MTILIINPNTTNAITDRIGAVAASLYPNQSFRCATGRFGARYISSRSAYAVAAHAALDAYAEHGHEVRSILLACFGDPGLLAIREIAQVPVIGLAEHVCQVAKSTFGRFVIVTGGERWVPMLWEFLALVGLENNCAGIRTVRRTGGEIAADPNGAMGELLTACKSAVDIDGADVIILGGAGLVGLADKLSKLVSKPVLCSVKIGIEGVVQASQVPFKKPLSGDFSMPPAVKAVGLGIQLTKILETGSE